MAAMANKHKIFDVFITKFIGVVAPMAVYMMYFKFLFRPAFFATSSSQNGSMSFSDAHISNNFGLTLQRLAYSSDWCIRHIENFYNGTAIRVTQKRHISNGITFLVELRNLVAFFLGYYLNPGFAVTFIGASYRRIESVFRDIVFFAAVFTCECFAVLFHGFIIPERRPKCNI